MLEVEVKLMPTHTPYEPSHPVHRVHHVHRSTHAHQLAHQQLLLQVFPAHEYVLPSLRQD